MTIPTRSFFTIFLKSSGFSGKTIDAALLVVASGTKISSISVVNAIPNEASHHYEHYMLTRLWYDSYWAFVAQFYVLSPHLP